MAHLIEAAPNPHQPFVVTAGVAVGAAMRELELPNKGPEAIVCVKDSEGTLRDLSFVPEQDSKFTPVPANTEDGRTVIRHSCTHVLAQAVQAEFPEQSWALVQRLKMAFTMTLMLQSLSLRKIFKSLKNE